ncbi:hypothetical protein C809_00144 [Lachnospiraceae bacterium MD335]|nr:hypothetical protein C809_00144 [Lachnospiraceae bacterium MD335]
MNPNVKITISTPSGWHNDTTKVHISVEDVAHSGNFSIKTVQAKVAQNGYVVSWCVGHLVELAQPESYGEQWKKWTYESLPVKPEKWQYEVKPDTKAQYDVLCQLMHREDVEAAICATDVG